MQLIVVSVCPHRQPRTLAPPEWPPLLFVFQIAKTRKHITYKGDVFLLSNQGPWVKSSHAYIPSCWGYSEEQG